ncbi:M20 family metallopeptidase [Poseidonibacter ostreae]|uniref:M20/M25/M40 family metallo-hydrolase n=1 Tax=Poseidonibacter ostreae TaxID=2654171 RepID=A0A6L4WSU1_9BACT|nr:M20 family metallopeptidase [Poseidonibacter ostreae]KAB7889167.1 M20/M25/M40 family metallo-hydrolase [Poseidonibacter ostreae]KAB7891632.1 M20/M25/M40 family metallo-hydrolase [Poseidonibacter ostreae]
MNYLNDLEKIININSYTKNKEGVDTVGKIMSSWLKELGFEETVFQREEIGNHQLFTSKRKENLKNILLLGHNDTVFPQGTFEGFTQDDTWVYGPGVCDMKGGNIVALESLRNLYKNNNEITNIDFLIVSDEESGSDDSKHVTLDIAKNYDLCFVFEAAGPNLEVVTGRKGVGTFTILVEGIPAHAGTSYLKGIDANLEASYKLQELSKLTNLDLGTTVNVGKITGGIGANTISPKCEMLLEIRYTTNKERDRLLSSLDKITNTSYIKGTTSTLSGLIQRDVMEANENQAKLIKQIEEITGTTIPTEKRGGVSDANHVSSCGVTTIDGFGPFGDGDHTKKERALKETFEQRINLMSDILKYFQK